MWDKVKKFLIGTIGLISYFWIAIRLSETLIALNITNPIIDYLLSVLFTTGLFLFLINEFIKAEKEDKQELLERAKRVYSLNYDKLEYIKALEINPNNNFKCILINKMGISFPLTDSNIPRTQEDLEKIDKRLMQEHKYFNQNSKK